MIQNKILKITNYENNNKNIDIKRKFIKTSPEQKILHIPIFDYNLDKLIKSQKIIASRVQNIENMFNNIKNESVSTKYYRILKKPDKITTYGYATLLILNNTYISSTLLTGYNMKYNNKTIYNTICFVQDKPFYKDGEIKHIGLSKNEIEDIMKIYDCVVGIDLLYIPIDATTSGLHYVTIGNYLITKVIMFSFTMYSKIFYYDASTIIQSNVDYYFTKYKGNMYYNPENVDKYELAANLYIFEPKTYYIIKSFYLIKNYTIIYKDRLKSISTPEENVLFFTIYPHWEKERIDINEIRTNFFNKIPYVQTNKKNKHYNFNLNVVHKPFLYNYYTDIDNNFFIVNFNYYKIWDENAKNIIIKYPQFKKYYEFIKTFRYTLF